MKNSINPESFRFLKALKLNNNRDWFNLHKQDYIDANTNFLEFITELIERFAQIDNSLLGIDAKSTIFRIYRDIRFSTDKSPYKTHLAASIKSSHPQSRIAGYYIHIEPGNSFLAGGVHMANPADLKAIRQEISYNSEQFLKIINGKEFKSYFTVEGETLARIPQGYDKSNPMIEFLKHKEFIVRYHLKDNEVLAADFLSKCNKLFKIMLPFIQFINLASVG